MDDKSEDEKHQVIEKKTTGGMRDMKDQTVLVTGAGRFLRGPESRTPAPRAPREYGPPN